MMFVWMVGELFISGDGCLEKFSHLMMVVWSVGELFTSGDGCLEGWRTVNIW